MNLPNILTLSRIIFAVFIVFFLFQNSLTGHLWAAFLFAVASITDFYDGYLAKKNGLTSDFGKIMDPIADKVLILSVFGSMAYLGMIDPWMVVVIAIREVAVTISRLKAMAEGRVLSAEAAGKMKTVAQIVTVIVILLFLIVEQSSFAVRWFYHVDGIWRVLIKVLMYACVGLTLYSGAIYFKNLNKREI